jgi:hypothetical protein
LSRCATQGTHLHERFCVNSAYIVATTRHYPGRRGIVVIASASRTEDPGFESRQGVRFLGVVNIAVLLPKFNLDCHCVYLRKRIIKKIFQKATMYKLCKSVRLCKLCKIGPAQDLFINRLVSFPRHIFYLKPETVLFSTLITNSNTCICSRQVRS